MKKYLNTMISIMALFGTVSNISAFDVFDNDLLRFGNGGHNSASYTITQDSVNNLGNLNQPFYYDGDNSRWFKLTYSSYPLDNRIGVGGDGSSDWNTNGTMTTNPALSGQVIDTSEFTKTDGDKGYGTIISTGTVTIGSNDLEIENKYELPEDKSYVQITTKITNLSAAPATNVRLWVGTRDDYVGTSDQPTKQRGQIEDGTFVLTSDSNTQSPALRIFSGETGVLFYSNSDRANTSINSCCSFENATNTNPTASSNEATGDGSYALYLRMNDLAQNESDELTWFYAGGTLAALDGIVSDVGSAASSAKDIVQNEDVNFSQEDFEDTEGSTYSRILITAIPLHGSLTLNSNPVSVNDEILSEDFVDLQYTPDFGFMGTDWFTWRGFTGTEFGEENNTTFNISMLDGDNDGFDDIGERGPNRDDIEYDGNNDGIRDSNQSNVYSGFFNNGNSYLTIVTEQPYNQDTTLIQEIDNPSPSDAPDNIQFPVGFLDIDVPVDMSGHAVVEIYLPEGVTASSYWKHTRTPDNNTPHWYEFMYDGTTGAIIEGNKITLHFQDGQRGDDDLLANNQIDDQGGPVITSVTTPLFGPLGYIILASLLGFFGIRRIKQ